jgi:hypothetical protein
MELVLILGQAPHGVNDKPAKLLDQAQDVLNGSTGELRLDLDLRKYIADKMIQLSVLADMALEDLSRRRMIRLAASNGEAWNRPFSNSKPLFLLVAVCA